MNEAVSCQPEVFQLWDASRPFPAAAEMPDLDCVTHVLVSYTQGKADCMLSIIPIRVLEGA